MKKNLEKGIAQTYLQFTTARILETKWMHGEEEVPQKMEVTPGAIETPQKVEITPESIR